MDQCKTISVERGMRMVWERAKEVLRKELKENVFNLWIDPLECLQVKDEVIQLACPDRFFIAYLSRNFLAAIQEQVDKLDDKKRKVVLLDGAVKSEIRVPVAPVIRNRKSRSASPQREQLRLPNMPVGGSRVRSLHPRYTFDEFMVGESNILAQSACRSISATDDSIGPCLYINSSTGLGKSHLTHAVAHHVMSKSPMTRLHYLTAQQFSQEMVQSIKSNSMDTFKSKYHDHCDLLMVEDIHALKGKQKTQMELNELLDTLIKSGKRVIFTSNSSPRELEGIDDEFRSRMASGLVTKIKAPDILTRHRIVQKKAIQHNVIIDEENIDFIAQHIKGDVRQIESALIAIRAKAQLQAGQIDMELIRGVVKSVVGIPKILTPSLIAEFVCKQFKVPMSALQSRSRKRVITFPRQVAMFLCRKHTQESLAQIGKEFNRDHSTVMHSIKVVNDLTTRNISVDEQVKLLSEKLGRL
jgi:chromosomal replication initiator protein